MISGIAAVTQDYLVRGLGGVHPTHTAHHLVFKLVKHILRRGNTLYGLTQHSTNQSSKPSIQPIKRLKPITASQ